MKRYTFELVIAEGNDEFWEEIEAAGKTGCDEVIESVKNALASHGYFFEEGENNTIRLKKFEDD